MFITCPASSTSIVIVVSIFITGTLLRVCPRLLEISVTAVTVNQTTVASKQNETFRGHLIDSRDQLAGVTNTSFNCVKATTSGMTFPICVYGETEDVWLSKDFIRGGYWERMFVDRFIRLLRRYPEIDFVELGANIGAFTLPAARITHVVAVEPYSQSMVRLLKSIQLGGLEKNVSLVFNAISNKRSTSKLGFHSGNVGGTYLKETDTTDCSSDGSCTRTIVLDDLLPVMRRRRAVMKVDVEGHQPHVFTNSTAAKFFALVDVPIILMEWKLCQQQNVSSQVLDLVHFFTARQYQVFSENDRPLGSNCRQWTNNVVFSKETVKF